MSQTIDVNGQSINYPETGDTNWGDEATDFAVQTSAAFGKLGLASGTSVDIGQTLDVTGNTTLDANLSVGGDASVTGILNVDSGVLYVDPVNNRVGINDTTPSEALDVTGNLNVTGDITFGGSFIAPLIKASTSAGLGIDSNNGTDVALFGAGGGAGTTLYGGLVGTTGNFADTTDATDADNAPLKTLGGMAVKKKLFVGTDVNVGGILNANGRFNLIPPGTIIQTSALVAPTGFLLCQGQQNLLRANYVNLFAVMPFTTSTITVAVANIITWTAHGLSTGHSIQFTTTGTLPTGLTANTIYFVRVLTVNTFELYGTLSQSMSVVPLVTTGRVTFTVTGSGTHTGLVYYYGNGIDNTNTTFGIPDFRGALPRGIGTSNGYIEAATVNLGEKTDDQFQGHYHDFFVGATSSAFGHDNWNNQIAKADNAGGRALESLTGGSKDQINNPKSDTVNGTPRTGRETRVKSLGVNYLIKT